MQSKLALTILLVAALACGGKPELPPTQTPVNTVPTASRLESIPSNARKMTPVQDARPPIVGAGLGQPQPLGAPINTAGAEDSPFITLDGQTLYFFFTPDLHVPPEKQLLDGVTGIWKSDWADASWGEPERVPLIQPGQLALDGCEFVLGNEMWFCSARAGNSRDIDLYTASLKDGIWTDWRNAGQQINVDYEVGEMHITPDGQTMVFGSTRAGGLGGYDLWISVKDGNGWGPPVNLGNPVNTAGDENRPYLSPDGRTLWFDGVSQKGLPGPAIFRSVLQADGIWSQPEEIVSQFAGEPNLSADGHTLYFVHHFFSADMSRMIEADIYALTIP
jgi:hypothetical protein